LIEAERRPARKRSGDILLYRRFSLQVVSESAGVLAEAIRGHVVVIVLKTYYFPSME